MRSMWLLFPLALTACPQPMTTTMTGDVELQEVYVSGAVLGGDKGGFRLELTGAAPTPLEVTITAEAAGVTFPTTVQIPAGKSVIEGEFTATRATDAQVTFTLGSQKLYRRVSVLSEMPAFSLGEYRVQAGADFSFGVYLPITLAKETTVTVTASDTSLVTVPGTGTIPRFGSSANVLAKAGSMTGTTRVTATYAGITRSGTVSVTNILTLTSAGAFPSRVLVGGMTPMLSLSLSGVPASDVAVTLTSSDPAVLTVPASVSIKAGSSSVQVPVTVAGAGSARITAQAAGETRLSNEIVVRSSNAVSNIYCGQVIVGQPGECSLSLEVPVLADTQVSLSADTAGIVMLPAVLNIAAGSSSASFNLTGQMAGSTRLTANLGATSKSTTVEVLSAQSSASGFTYFYVNNNGRAPGTMAALTMGFTAAAADRTLTIASSNTMVFNPPTSVTVGAGSSYLELNSALVGVGQSLVTVTLGGASLQTIVTSSNAGNVYLYLGGGAFEVGAMTLISLNLPAPVTADTMIPLTQSTMGVIDVPASVVVRAGQSSTQFVVRAVAAGDVRLNASYRNQYFSGDYRVTTTPTMSVNAPSVNVGSQGSVSVNFDCVLARDRVVSLSQTGTGRYNMASSVIVGTGDSNASTYVTGATAGDVTVTATLGTEMRTTMATVQP